MYYLHVYLKKEEKKEKKKKKENVSAVWDMHTVWICTSGNKFKRAAPK